MTTYDALIVGAGSAGAVLAARCSEDPATSVCLLEAGPDNATADTPPGVASPNFVNALLEAGRIWPALVATHAEGRVDAPYIRGRGAGGSSAVNAMGALRGTPADYERWANELGCVGWGWAEMLDAFLTCEDDADYGGDGLHGKGGPLPLERVPANALPPLTRCVRAAALDLGYPVCDSAHATGATGLTRMALNQRAGHRVSTNDAYLEAARARVNLVVRGDVLVDRVVFDGRRAIGVRTAAGEEIEARETFVSAGTIHSPALLLRSGITELPIGENLQEHAMTPGIELALRPEARMASPDAPIFSSVLRYSSGLAAAGDNDMQIVWFDAAGPSAADLETGRLLAAVMRVFSTGRVSLRADDPNIDPIVEFRLLSDERDLVRLRDAVRRLIDLVRHPGVADAVTSAVALTTPIDELDTDAAIDAWLRDSVTDYVHAVGTCAMNSVVDTDCRVIGYDGIRVCDASVMPDVPRANTHLTTVAIAERLVKKMRA